MLNCVVPRCRMCLAASFNILQQSCIQNVQSAYPRSNCFLSVLLGTWGMYEPLQRVKKPADTRLSWPVGGRYKRLSQHSTSALSCSSVFHDKKSFCGILKFTSLHTLYAQVLNDGVCIYEPHYLKWPALCTGKFSWVAVIEMTSLQDVITDIQVGRKQTSLQKRCHKESTAPYLSPVYILHGYAMESDMDWWPNIRGVLNRYSGREVRLGC